MRQLVEKLEDLKQKLDAEKLSGVKEFDDWETGFLTSVLEQAELRSEHSLSDKQKAKIHDLYDKYCI